MDCQDLICALCQILAIAPRGRHTVTSTLLTGKPKCGELGLAQALQAANGSVFRLWAGDLMLLSYPSSISPPPHGILDNPFTLPPPPQPRCGVLPLPSLLIYPWPSLGSGLGASALTTGPRPPAPHWAMQMLVAMTPPFPSPSPLKLGSLNTPSREVAPEALS